ncbi:MAG: DUF2863 family protein [Betaproteobacteria bacterium]|nr:DUF2863 family protein [Betaproteobacteria bacterium]
MKRSRLGRRSNLSRDAEQLVWLATGLAESGSRTEDRFWENRLIDLTEKILESGDEEVLESALDHLHAAAPRAYDELADMIESRAEAGSAANADTEELLIAAPILAWSRFQIPANTIPAAQLATLRVQLQAHVLAKDVQFGLADYLFSPDQLPQGYCETRRFGATLGQAAEQDQNLRVITEGMPETARFLSDVRYLLATVVAKRGAPLFRWQEADGSREQALNQWRAQGGAVIATLMPGCAFEVVLPEAYFAASREADRVSRPYSILASVAFLTTTLECPPGDLRAIVAPFYEKQIEEYRIGFAQKNSDQIVHGVVWPLLGAEDETSEATHQIETALRESGIGNVLQLDTRFPLEYCDDCGAPLYPSPDGEAVHAELPEEKAEAVPRHLH